MLPHAILTEESIMSYLGPISWVHLGNLGFYCICKKVEEMVERSFLCYNEYIKLNRTCIEVLTALGKVEQILLYMSHKCRPTTTIQCTHPIHPVALGDSCWGRAEGRTRPEGGGWRDQRVRPRHPAQVPTDPDHHHRREELHHHIPHPHWLPVHFQQSKPENVTRCQIGTLISGLWLKGVWYKNL